MLVMNGLPAKQTCEMGTAASAINVNKNEMEFLVRGCLLYGFFIGLHAAYRDFLVIPFPDFGDAN